VQTSQLQHHEEQEKDDGAARVLEILPLLSKAHGPQGEQVIWLSGHLVIWLLIDRLKGQIDEMTR
jgi:hypothetical protein